MRKGFFTYPWDLMDEGVGAALGTMAGRCACNAIALTPSYHSARIFRPRLSPRIHTRPGAAAVFFPQPKHYENGAPLPVVDHRVAEARVLQQTREWCAKNSMDLGFWTVGLHNSTLGNAHPELCMRGCFDDVYDYILCPSNPRVRAYLRGLITDLCDQFRPQRILLETGSFLGMLHWVHHEKFPTTIGESEQALSFLCFCPSCRAHAATLGLDAEGVRRQVATWMDALLEDERGALPLSFTMADLPALLIESPALYAYLQMRIEIVASLVQEIRDIAAGYGVRMEVMPAAWGQPVARAWREGAALRRLAQVCDALLPLAYFADPQEVQSDLRWVKLLSGGAPFSVGMSAGHPIAISAGNLAAKAAICAKEGAEGIYYYNYGMLTNERLDWVGRANSQV
jgi:hypothetical protein